MSDFKEITNPPSGKDARRLKLHFANDLGKAEWALEDLSDGERCFVIFALTAAANAAYGPLLCFWDEPENFLAPAEVGHAVVALRRAFQKAGS